MTHGENLGNGGSDVAHVEIRPAQAAVQEARHDIEQGHFDGHDRIRTEHGKEDHNAGDGQAESRYHDGQGGQGALYGDGEAVV